MVGILYSSWERPVNERSNRILCRFMPKGKSMRNYADDQVLMFSDEINAMPRKRLSYRTPEELFEEHQRCDVGQDCGFYANGYYYVLQHVTKRRIPNRDNRPWERVCVLYSYPDTIGLNFVFCWYLFFVATWKQRKFRRFTSRVLPEKTNLALVPQAELIHNLFFIFKFFYTNWRTCLDNPCLTINFFDKGEYEFMEMTFRWYGDGNDSVSLKQIRQIPGCTGIMGVLDQYAAGEEWPLNVIQDYVCHVHQAGLKIEVIESVNVHEDIKLGKPTRDYYIENYIKTIRNLAACGIKVIIYNFMPVFDWLRTDLSHYVPEDGSRTLYFDEKDLHDMTPVELVKNTENSSNGFALPGWEPTRLAELQTVLEEYKNVDNDKLRKNYQYFLDAILPVCEEVGVKMACHPDDPAWPIFGLPRVAHSQNDFDKIVKMHDSSCNTICLCTGSLGSNPKNDIPNMIQHFGTMHRISCAHVRNIKHLGYHKFRESSHLSRDGSLDMYRIMKTIYETCPDIYIRPDHGRMIWDEIGRPGYGLYDRALGVAYLNGLWEAIDKDAHEVLGKGQYNEIK